ncbi:MAG: MBL fold metallo-hydrolase [Pirellulales bacterium]|nr:MBL fold metallo-hydrolase [Pirellulales bacterium]
MTHFLSRALVVAIFWVGFHCGSVLAAEPTPAPQPGKTLNIYWIDVEGGAATLIVTPVGESVLIDSGNPGPRDADRIFQVATKVAGLRKLDHLVTTHYHIDHFGGAAQLSQVLPIGTVHDNGEFAELRERPSDEYLRFPCERRVQIQPGGGVELQSPADQTAVKLTCLCARQRVIQPPANVRLARNPLTDEAVKKPADTSDNANSIVLLLQFGDFRFFDGGDLTWNTEEKLVCPFNLVGEVDLYQANHHGLDVSNNPVLLKSLRPRVAVINNGPTKGCMPLTYGTLSQLDSVQAIYQLHKNERMGEKEGNTAGEFIANDSGAACQGNYVQCTVAADGKSYVLKIPAKQHQQRFDCKSALP